MFIKKIKTTFKLLLLLVIFIAPFLVLADEALVPKTETLSPYAKSDSTSGSFDYRIMEQIPGLAKAGSQIDFYTYVSYVYKFGIGAVGICAMLMIIIGGYMYMAAAGNNASMENAKGVITDAVVGLILAFASYLILYVINPDLVRIKKMEPMPILSQEYGTSGGTKSSQCVPDTSNGCTATVLTPYFGDNTLKASSICKGESGGLSIPSGVDKCQPGGESVSWGLFQINISSNTIGGLPCPDAFDKAYTSKNHSCNIIDKTLYDKCVAAAKNPTINIQKAVELSKKGSTWRQWGFNSKCNF